MLGYVGSYTSVKTSTITPFLSLTHDLDECNMLGVIYMCQIKIPESPVNRLNAVSKTDFTKILQLLFRHFTPFPFDHFMCTDL